MSEESGMTEVGKGAKLEDSNLANYGSKEHKDVRLAAAKSEPAWEGCGEKPGLEMWRIEKFKVVKKGKEQHGKFFNGDSYIVLNTYKPDPAEEKLAYNVHFWIGSESSQDEYGTAAYKTVELDDYLGDLPVQFRETEGHESKEFLDMHGGKITIMNGGIESGFNKVKPEEYTPRLMWIKGTGSNVRVTQVDNKVTSLNQGDTFLMDNGLDLIVWNGPRAGVHEKRKALEICQELQADRNGRPKMRVLDGVENDKEFWPLLGNSDEKAPATESLAPATSDKVEVSDRRHLFELSDRTGTLTRTKVADGALKPEMLKTDEVFILDVELTVYTWVGKGASKAERSNGIKYAMDYLEENKMPAYTPVIRVIEGHEPASFLKHFEEPKKKPNYKIEGSVGTAERSSSNFSVRLGRKSPLQEHEDWAIWDTAIKTMTTGKGCEALVGALPDDKCCFVWYRFVTSNVGNTGEEIKNHVNVVLHWKPTGASGLAKVKSNGSLLKAEEKCPGHKGTIEVTGKKNLTTENITARWKPGSGSKVIQDDED